MRKMIVSVAVAMLLLAGFSRLAMAHALLVTATPAIHGTVHGPAVEIDLKFNSRVDSAHSLLSLLYADGKTQPVSLATQHGANELAAHINLTPGSYTLRWQALSSDGHISRGEIPFAVE